MDTYTLELQRQLARNEVIPVLKNLLDTLINASSYSEELKKETEPLRDKIIMLKSMYISVKSEQEQNLIDIQDAKIEIARTKKSLLNILNKLDDDYPLLAKYFAEQDEEKAWAMARASNSIASYQEYFNKYPNGKYKGETQKLLKELQSIEEKKNKTFIQKAENERKRRLEPEQQTQVKTSSSPMRYVLMGVGALLLAGIAYFLVPKLTTADRNKEVKTETAVETRENPRDNAREEEEDSRVNPGEETKDPPKDPGGKLQLDPGKFSAEQLKNPDLIKGSQINTNILLQTAARTWQGTWSTNFGELRLKTEGNRVYGDYKHVGTIEGIYDASSRTLKGTFDNAGRIGRFSWKVNGQEMQGEWYFNGDTRRNTKWTGKRTKSSLPNIQNFPWEGIWETKPFGKIELEQKGNVVRGKGDSFAFTKASFNAQTGELKGTMVDGKVKTSAEFTVKLKSSKGFTGSWKYLSSRSGVKNSGTFEGIRIK